MNQGEPVRATASTREPVTREQIVAVAAKVFRRYGYRGATLGQIAERVGIKKASLYHHIDSKESLLVEILETGLRPTLERIQTILEAPDLTSCEKLRAAVHRHVVDTAGVIDSHAVFMNDFEFVSDEEQRAQYLKGRRRYEELFEHLVEPCLTDHRKDFDVRIVVLGLLGMCNSMPNWYRPDGRLGAEEIANTFAELAKEMVGCE